MRFHQTTICRNSVILPTTPLTTALRKIRLMEGISERPFPMLIGYMRVSTAEQDIALQRDALEKAGCERLFEDIGISGAKACLLYTSPSPRDS